MIILGVLWVGAGVAAYFLILGPENQKLAAASSAYETAKQAVPADNAIASAKKAYTDNSRVLLEQHALFVAIQERMPDIYDMTAKYTDQREGLRVQYQLMGTQKLIKALKSWTKGYKLGNPVQYSFTGTEGFEPLLTDVKMVKVPFSDQTFTAVGYSDLIHKVKQSYGYKNFPLIMATASKPTTLPVAAATANVGVGAFQRGMGGGRFPGMGGAGMFPGGAGMFPGGAGGAAIPPPWMSGPVGMKKGALIDAGAYRGNQSETSPSTEQMQAIPRPGGGPAGASPMGGPPGGGMGGGGHGGPPGMGGGPGSSPFSAAGPGASPFGGGAPAGMGGGAGSGSGSGTGGSYLILVDRSDPRYKPSKPILRMNYSAAGAFFTKGWDPVAQTDLDKAKTTVQAPPTAPTKPTPAPFPGLFFGLIGGRADVN
jgi:hypothetical protein